ncbi:ATP-binding cassette domain-containing protein [Mesoaciditoga lauensis]|uniref:ATP-binding cassette domain-containing protein n=1 Tax=Mesoaciditoga lauensis TaxID=1495039 RepID=UPI0005631DFA|nr:ATP-binding cassette domain-containing protein [Mesoaciditoga lauensis]
MIKVRELSFSDGTKVILNKVNLDVKEGEFVAVLGLNGSGKTSLFKMLNALMIPTSGYASVDGLKTTEKENVWEIRKKVGMIFQNPESQIVGTTVEEDVAFGMENIGIPREEMIKRVDEVLNFVGLIQQKKREPFHLSGGQKQLLCIASTLAMRPKYIIMDEPTSMIDPIGRKKILKIMKDLNAKGKTILFSTHILEEIVMAKRVVYLRNGKIIFDGEPIDILNEVKEEFGISEFLEFQMMLYKNGFIERLMNEEELEERLKSLADNA